MRRMIAVVQARTGSTRLPGKVLRDLGGRPVLGWVVGAAQASAVCDEIVVATTSRPEDDAVAAAASSFGASVVRGEVDDVLARFLRAAESVGAAPDDGIVRLTADCPLLDRRLIFQCVHAFRSVDVDYVTTDHAASVAHGFDVEVVALDALRRIDGRATGADRTHVTSYIASRPDEFRSATIGVAPPCADLRVTLDEPADAVLLDTIVAELGERASDWRAVVGLLRSRPDLVAINAHVPVKPLASG